MILHSSESFSERPATIPDRNSSHTTQVCWLKTRGKLAMFACSGLAGFGNCPRLTLIQNLGCSGFNVQSLQGCQLDMCSWVDGWEFSRRRRRFRITSLSSKVTVGTKTNTVKVLSRDVLEAWVYGNTIWNSCSDEKGPCQYQFSSLELRLRK